MKFLMSTFFTLQSCFLFAQEVDSTYNCNDKWLEELIKTDSISKKNRIQDCRCYQEIFDSLENSKLYSKSQMLHAIGKFVKYTDSALAEIYFYRAFEYVFNHTDLFFTEMKSEPESGMKTWARMIYLEYAQRSASEMNFSEHIIQELELNLKNKKLRSWILFQKELKEIDKEHQKMFEDYYKK